MTFFDDRWDAIDDLQWSSFADAWLAEIEGDRDHDGGEFAEKVTCMMFMARPELLWKFILLAVERAKTDLQFGYIAAGPVERILGKFGSDYIGLVEQMAHDNSSFARTLTGVRRYQMTENIWNRVQVLQKRCADPLTTSMVCHQRFIELEKRYSNKLREALEQRRDTSQD